MRVWIDIKNSHEPLFFKSIMNGVPDHDYHFTCRDYAEITSLLDKYHIPYDLVGHRPEGHIFKRGAGFIDRLLKLMIRVPKYDVSLNHCSSWSIYNSWLRGRPSIVLNDNDINPKAFSKKFMNMISYVISPIFIDKNYYIQQGLKANQVYQYDGFKEDIYIADYNPDNSFCSDLPFDDFVTIRAENSQALYYGRNKVSIVPELVKKFNAEGIGVIFLPRYKKDREILEESNGVYIPNQGMNGLDLCYYSRAVLTGAGTFAREAGSMGRCAVSFFGGEKLLSVDKEMIRRKWVFHSRDSDEIINHVKYCDKKPINLGRSKKVKNEVIRIIKTIFDDKIK